MHDGLRDHLTRTEICPFRASLTLLACAMRAQLARLVARTVSETRGSFSAFRGIGGDPPDFDWTMWALLALRWRKETHLVGRFFRIG